MILDCNLEWETIPQATTVMSLWFAGLLALFLIFALNILEIFRCLPFSEFDSNALISLQRYD